MPYGRGGAGNIQAQAAQREHTTPDLEAGPAHNPTPNNSQNPNLHPSHEQAYAHSGRGGAGNYYSPQELSKKGHFNNAHKSHILGDGTQAPGGERGISAGPSLDVAGEGIQQPTRTVGRGGVGNYMFGSGEIEVKAVVDRVEAVKVGEKIKDDVEKGVEETLAMPEKAKLPLEVYEQPLDLRST